MSLYFYAVSKNCIKFTFNRFLLPKIKRKMHLFRDSAPLDFFGNDFLEELIRTPSGIRFLVATKRYIFKYGPRSSVVIHFGSLRGQVVRDNVLMKYELPMLLLPDNENNFTANNFTANNFIILAELLESKTTHRHISPEVHRTIGEF